MFKDLEKKSGIYSRTVFVGEHTLHNIHLPVSQFHIQNATAQDLSNTPKPSPPEELGIFLSAQSSASPSLGPRACTCVGIAITQLIKRHSPIWKWLAVETHQQLQSFGSRLCRQHRPGLPFCTSHSSPMGNGWKICFCYTNLFPSSKPSMGLH